MKDHVVESYENYREEDRLSTNNARKIEFLTTVRILDDIIGDGRTILDCAAGTGIYAFYFADKGHTVTATDITPRHVEIIQEILKTKDYTMKTAVLDATDMSMFADESFDVVLNMGPFYHLTEEIDRERCLNECCRVLKKGGLLVTAYIPRFYIFQLIAMQNEHFLDGRLAKQLIETGVLRHDDEKCFWTDTYYSSASEMETLYGQHGITVVDHFAQDGQTPQFHEIADKWNDEQFRIWCDYHYSVCREKSILGTSNHVVIIGRKD
ncbi:MAG: class I SAM-dependent methyltransferase [Ruminococcus sp.]|nr:class I SAM-dependent methyltransferase [Ruminococcus sp.]